MEAMKPGRWCEWTVPTMRKAVAISVGHGDRLRCERDHLSRPDVQELDSYPESVVNSILSSRIRNGFVGYIEQITAEEVRRHV